MKEKGLPREEIEKILKDAKGKDLDYSKGKILSSMCTLPAPFSKEIWSSFIETNLGDAGLFCGTKRLENEVIGILGALLKNEDAKGFMVSGGTEANIMALWAARNRAKREKPEFIAPMTAHFSFEKASDLLNMRLVRAKTLADHTVDAKDVEKHITDNTVAVVGIAGNTEYGTVDNIEMLGEIATENSLYLHVDAAFGGFVLPFLKELGYPTRRFDFSIPGVSSIATDPHKMGMSPIPSGCILFRNGSFLEHIETSSPYLTEKKQFTIIGTRTGASAASTYAVLKSFGREGYRDNVKGCMELSMRLYGEIKRMRFDITKPVMNIIVFNHDEINTIADSLAIKGWTISRTRMGEIRLVLMPHVSEDSIDEFIRDLEEIVKHLKGV
ncbi:MAG: tyrosine decarboxylase MfnA [Candidatus Hydrothermarchaeales archaeon]